MPSSIEAQIKDRITAFASELDLLVRRSTLETLQNLLASGAGAAPRRGRPAGRRRGPGRRGSGSGANLDEAAAKIAAHVQANDGQGISAIAAATGVDLKVAKRAALQLVNSGQLKKSGQKRGTIYHVGSGKPARSAKGKRGKRGKGRARKAKAA